MKQYYTGIYIQVCTINSNIPIRSLQDCCSCTTPFIQQYTVLNTQLHYWVLITYRTSLNKSPPWIEAGLKLKPGRGLHMYEARTCLVSTHINCNGMHEDATTWPSNWKVGYRCCGGRKQASGLLLSYCCHIFLRTRRTKSSWGMWPTISVFYNRNSMSVNKCFLWQPVLAPCHGKVSCLVDVVAPEINASLDLTLVLNRRFSKNLAKEIDFYLRIYSNFCTSTIIGNKWKWRDNSHSHTIQLGTEYAGSICFEDFIKCES